MSKTITLKEKVDGAWKEVTYTETSSTTLSEYSSVEAILNEQLANYLEESNRLKVVETIVKKLSKDKYILTDAERAYLTSNPMEQ